MIFDRVNPIQQQIIIEKNKHKVKRLHHRKRILVQYTTCLARNEGREGGNKSERVGLKLLFFFAKPFTIGGFYIAPEEETDKENIDISSFSQLTTNSYS